MYMHIFHWILLCIRIEEHKVWVYDSLRQDKSKLTALLKFATECWSSIGIQIPPSTDPYEILQSFKHQLQVPFFMKIIILMSWIGVSGSPEMEKFSGISKQQFNFSEQS